jgi:hypothetical protein
VRRVLVGAVLVIAGIAAFIEAHTHAPRVSNLPPLRTVARVDVPAAPIGEGDGST